MNERHHIQSEAENHSLETLVSFYLLFHSSRQQYPVIYNIELY